MGYKAILFLHGRKKTRGGVTKNIFLPQSDFFVQKLMKINQKTSKFNTKNRGKSHEY